MQIRTLRQNHVDSEYCKVIFKYFKGVASELANVVHENNAGMNVRFISMADKSKVRLIGLCICRIIITIVIMVMTTCNNNIIFSIMMMLLACGCMLHAG